MNAQTTDIREEPWYKQGWPWFLISLPALAVVGGIITAVYAVSSWDGLVADDYYKEGQMVVEVIDRLELARTLGLKAHATLRDDHVSIELTAAQAKDLPAELHLKVIHPTHSGSDQELVLEKEQSGLYSGKISPLRAGHWQFQIEDESRSWRMNGAANLPTETEVLIQPEALVKPEASSQPSDS
jgi:hypothetical protein